MKISEYKCIHIENKVYNNQKFYVEDLNKFVDLVRDNINRETIIELKYVLKMVEYLWRDKRQEKIEMNNFETSLLSYIDFYHDAFTSPNRITNIL